MARELKTAMRYLVRLRVLLPHYAHVLFGSRDKGKDRCPLMKARIVWGLRSSHHIMIIHVHTCCLPLKFIRLGGPMLSTFMFLEFITVSGLNKYMLNVWI